MPSFGDRDTEGYEHKRTRPVKSKKFTPGIVIAVSAVVIVVAGVVAYESVATVIKPVAVAVASSGPSPAPITRTVTSKPKPKPVPTVTKTVAAKPAAPATSNDPPAQAPAAAQAPTATQAPAAADLSSCGGGIYVNSGTSCSFAENVEAAWQASDLRGTGDSPKAVNVTAYSPVTGLTYTMNCVPAIGPWTCTGANNALVEFGLYQNAQGCDYVKMDEAYCPATGTYVPMTDPNQPAAPATTPAAATYDPWSVV